ncbi:hypothetical protein LIER_42547 [Lithospermum erythrorhizon]|uniref:Reverse transcriptase zinc-binding domain-containing protein n=1 Tax=Lithospermum erythrorhizon TaxID=34254 RepID=A0AAV3NH89_LITER
MKRNGDIGRGPSGSSSTAWEVEGCWKEIWQLKIPPHIKMFLWRCLHNIIPTRDRLGRRGVIVESNFVFCHNSYESLTHILLACPFSSKLWFASPWNLNTKGQIWNSFKEWWTIIYARLKQQGRLDILEGVVCMEIKEWHYI